MATASLFRIQWTSPLGSRSMSSSTTTTANHPFSINLPHPNSSSNPTLRFLSSSSQSSFEFTQQLISPLANAKFTQPPQSSTPSIPTISSSSSSSSPFSQSNVILTPANPLTSSVSIIDARLDPCQWRTSVLHACIIDLDQSRVLYHFENDVSGALDSLPPKFWNILQSLIMNLEITVWDRHPIEKSLTGCIIDLSTTTTTINANATTSGILFGAKRIQSSLLDLYSRFIIERFKNHPLKFDIHQQFSLNDRLRKAHVQIAMLDVKLEETNSRIEQYENALFFMRSRLLDGWWSQIAELENDSSGGNDIIMETTQNDINENEPDNATPRDSNNTAKSTEPTKTEPIPQRPFENPFFHPDLVSPTFIASLIQGYTADMELHRTQLEHQGGTIYSYFNPTATPQLQSLSHQYFQKHNTLQWLQNYFDIRSSCMILPAQPIAITDPSFDAFFIYEHSYLSLLDTVEQLRLERDSMALQRSLLGKEEKIIFKEFTEADEEARFLLRKNVMKKALKSASFEKIQSLTEIGNLPASAITEWKPPNTKKRRRSNTDSPVKWGTTKRRRGDDIWRSRVVTSRGKGNGLASTKSSRFGSGSGSSSSNVSSKPPRSLTFLEYDTQLYQKEIEEENRESEARLKIFNDFDEYVDEDDDDYFKEDTGLEEDDLDELDEEEDDYGYGFYTDAVRFAKEMEEEMRERDPDFSSSLATVQGSSSVLKVFENIQEEEVGDGGELEFAAIGEGSEAISENCSSKA